MQTLAFRVLDGSRLQQCDAESVLASPQNLASPRYLHIAGYEHDELADWLEQFQLSDFAKRRVLKSERLTKVIAAKDALIIAIRVLGDAQSEAPQQTIFLCLPNLLVSFQRTSLLDLEAYVDDVERQTLARESTTAILTALLLREMNRMSDEVHETRSSIFELDRLMDRSPHSISLDVILTMKDHLLKVLAVAEEQNACVQSVNSIQSEMLDFDGVQGSRNLLVAGTPAIERIAARLEKRIADLRERYDTFQQEKTNRRLAALTILSAVFLPLSLIAGIWGMNFAYMPELQLRWGYPLALISMCVVATCMILFFRRRGWLE